MSLLNALYKLVAVIIHKRIACCLDPRLQTTQYGLRANRGTADALQYVRRMIQKGESIKDVANLLVQLALGTAFDNINHDKLHGALSRTNIPRKSST